MPVFFLDRSLGRYKVARAMRDGGADVEVHDDHFLPDTPDADWLTDVAKRGWHVITKDDRLRFNPLERRAIEQSGARVFILAHGNMSGEEMAAIILDAMPTMMGTLERKSDAFIARIQRGGRVRDLPRQRET